MKPVEWSALTRSVENSTAVEGVRVKLPRYPRPVRDIHQIRCGCLYRIDFLNGKSYVGITTLAEGERLADHEYAAFKRKASSVLHRAMVKYGRGSYSIKVLAIASFSYLKSAEIAAIKVFKTKTPLGYNMTDGGDGQLDKQWSKESREKLSSKRFGVDYLTPEARAAFGKRFLGRVFSPEHRARLSEAGRRRKRRVLGPMSLEHRERLSASARGRKHTSETRAKLAVIAKEWWEKHREELHAQ